MNSIQHRLLPRPQVAIGVVGLMMAGCGTASPDHIGDSRESVRGEGTLANTSEPGSSTEPATDTTEDKVAGMHALVVSITATGDLCPDGTWSAIDGRDPHIGFSRHWSGPMAPLRCTIAMDIEVPVGYQMAAPIAVFRGATNKTTFERRYSYEDLSGSPNVLSSEPSSLQFADKTAGTWSPSCGDRHQVRFTMELIATMTAEDSYFELETVDLPTSWVYGVGWRACNSDEPLSMEPADAGEFCGGGHHRACANSLACEYASDKIEGLTGECVDPNEKVPARGIGEVCGGFRNIQCETGLVCLYLTQEDIDRKIVGHCQPAVGDIGNLCGSGYLPNIPCKNGLFCAPGHSGDDSMECAAADGNAASWCGFDGMPECKEGLTCVSNTCQALGKRGQPCIALCEGDEPCTYRCDDNLQCVDHRCVLPGDGRSTP